MSAPANPRTRAPMSSPPAAAEWIYRVLLCAYPRAFRAEYGREMTLLFRDQCRTTGAGSLGFWLHVLWDLAQSAPAMRADEWRARGRSNTRTTGVNMKIFAMVTMLLGAVAVLSAAVEGVMGVRQDYGGAYLISILLGVVAGALLLVAGVGAMRDTPSGQMTAIRAAIASLAAFLLARGLFGWMSIVTQIIGIAIPLAILAVMHRPRGRPAIG